MTTPRGVQLLERRDPHALQLGGVLASSTIAYETWGTLNEARDNALLICTGLSASSHVRSHADAPEPGWWQAMVGPGLAIDTERFFVVCANVLGGCFGSTGPASPDPRTGQPYALDFPLVTVWDMVEAHAFLLDALGIDRVDTVLGASMGGMQAMAFAARHPERCRRMVAISAPGRSYPLSISLRFAQRQALMRDPAWEGGRYHGGPGPRSGLHLARQIGTITYRSGPEWDRRFARERREGVDPLLDADFEIESYLMHQGDRFVDRFDANSYLYLSKAMDLFDLGDDAASYEEGVTRIRARSLMIGVTTDLLFPIHQQEEVARILRAWGRDCRFVRLDSVYGHDAFLIEIERFGRILSSFLDDAGRGPEGGPMGDWDALAAG